MNELEPLFTGKVPPAIYRLKSRATKESLAQRIEAHGWRCFVLDGDAIEDKRSFLHACATSMHFPDYFGKNWDAFEECLNDLSWLPAPGYVLLYDNVENFARHAPKEWSVAHDILVEAVKRWQNEQIPFVVLLRKTGQPVRGVPHLPR